jgi:hypothetical protein
MIIHSPRDTRFTTEFAGMMRKIGPQMGIQVCDARIASLRDDRTDSYLRVLRENINPSLQLVVIIFPSARDDRYSAVKKLCCSDMPIASQVSSLLGPIVFHNRVRSCFKVALVKRKGMPFLSHFPFFLILY